MPCSGSWLPVRRSKRCRDPALDKADLAASQRRGCGPAPGSRPEPRDGNERLIQVRLLIAPLLVAALLGTGEGAPPAEAATVTATAGIGGYVHPDRPVRITVEVASPALLVGEMVVELDGLSREVPVEVPGGGEKVLRGHHAAIRWGPPHRLAGRRWRRPDRLPARAPLGTRRRAVGGVARSPRDGGGPRLGAVNAAGTAGGSPSRSSRPIWPIQVRLAISSQAPATWRLSSPDELSGVVSWVRRGGRVIAEGGRPFCPRGRGRSGRGPRPIHRPAFGTRRAHLGGEHRRPGGADLGRSAARRAHPWARPRRVRPTGQQPAPRRHGYL